MARRGRPDLGDRPSPDLHGRPDLGDRPSPDLHGRPDLRHCPDAPAGQPDLRGRSDLRGCPDLRGEQRPPPAGRPRVAHAESVHLLHRTSAGSKVEPRLAEVVADSDLHRDR